MERETYIKIICKDRISEIQLKDIATRMVNVLTDSDKDLLEGVQLLQDVIENDPEMEITINE